MDQNKQKWEVVIIRETDDWADLLERAPVPGGWLYRSHVGGGGGFKATCAMCFVADQKAMAACNENAERNARRTEIGI